ncbi:MAG: hypothetical protein UV82_C0014G0004 [Candidatus Magasanikbacteria bacterium GW2011_GWD2_43_18]|nr:MAG: hypothetical protein UV82_C0014G0004 [Candidatus Magasanikbacteria bacterium GW2011_GWD2_43_18]
MSPRLKLARHEAAPIYMQCALSRKAHFVRHVTLKAAALLFVGDPGIEPGTSTLSV